MATKTTKKPTKSTKTSKEEKNPKKETKPKGNAWTIDKATTFKGASIDKTREIKSATIAPVERASSATVAPVTNQGRTTIDTSKDAEFRGKQLALTTSLEDAAAGRGPSLATLQLKAAQDRNMAQTLSAIATQRANPAASIRNIRLGLATGNQAAGAEAARQRVAEQIQARQQLSDVIAAGRGVDTATATAQGQLDAATEANNAAAANRAAEVQAGLVQQTNLANQTAGNTQSYNQAVLTQQADQATAELVAQRAQREAELKQSANQANAAAINARANAQGGIEGEIQRQRIAGASQVTSAGIAGSASVRASQANAFGDIEAERIRTEGANYRNDSNLVASVGDSEADRSGAYDANNVTASNNERTQNIDTNGNLIQGSGDALATAAASDERLKTDIHDGDEDAKKFLSSLSDKVFKYKDRKLGDGKQLGVMAQDLEKTPAGRQMVVDTPKGKFVDFGKGMAAMLASLVSMNDRMRKLEGARA